MGELELLLRAVRHDLDDLDRRLGALEGSPWATFRQEEATRQRRRIIARMRAEGLSAERIARALGAGRGTVQRDLRALGIDTPNRVIGADNKTYRVNGR